MQPVFAAVQEYARVFGMVGESPSSSDSGSSMVLTEQLTRELTEGVRSVHDMIHDAIARATDHVENQSAKFYHAHIPELVFQLVDPSLMTFLSQKDEDDLKKYIDDPSTAIQTKWEDFKDMELASASDKLNFLLVKKQEYQEFWRKVDEEGLKNTVPYVMALYFHYKKVALDMVFSRLGKHEKRYVCNKED